MFSLILPTLGNREMEMRRLLESLLLQENVQLELVVVVQANYDQVYQLLKEYMREIDILIVKKKEKGLSKARNIGLKYVQEDSIVVFTDDDCWYPPNVFSEIEKKVLSSDIATFQIVDPVRNELFTNYPISKSKHRSAFKSFKVSSIEIFINTKNVDKIDIVFDEEFGLGAKYPSGEENILLLDLIKKEYSISYYPEIVVYHLINETPFNTNDLYVKGAFFRRNFGISSSLVLGSLFLIKKIHLIDAKVSGLFAIVKGSLSYEKKSL